MPIESVQAAGGLLDGPALDQPGRIERAMAVDLGDLGVEVAAGQCACLRAQVKDLPYCSAGQLRCQRS